MPLPVFRTSFVGRESESAAVVDAVARPGAVVNIIGPGGVGKTRLASKILAEYHGPSVFVDLSGARNDAELVDAVLTSLGIRGDAVTPQRDAAGVVGTWLSRRRRMLLVLDNFEQLPPSASTIVRGWRRTARSPVFMVTSRRPLKLPGEACVRLDPMPTEDAVQLFFDRVPARARPLDPARDAERVREVVERLDGLPLAIELAAARLDILGLDTLAGALADRFGLLRDPGRRGDRQGSLWRLIEWSWELLEPWQQEALLRLSLFRGGAPLDGARYVIGPSARGEPNALDALQSLAQASLLRVDAPVAGVPRYGMLASIRDFVRQHWAGPEARREGEDRHAAFYLEHGAAWGRAYQHDEVARERVIAERDNFDALMERSLARDDREGAVAAVLVLCAIRYAEWRTWRHSQLARANAVLDAADRHGLEPSRELALAYSHRAYTLRRGGHLQAALDDARRAHALAEQLGQANVTASMAGYLANMLMLVGRDEEARAVFERTLEAGEALGNDQIVGIALHALANDDMRRGAYDRAEERLQRSIAAHERAANALIMSRPLGRLGSLRYYTGDLDGALELLRRALAHEQAGDSPHWIAVRAASLGRCLHAAGRMDDAAAAFETASSHLEDEVAVVEAEVWMGLFELDRGEVARARALLEAAAAALPETAASERELLTASRIGLGLLGVRIGDLGYAAAQSAALRRIAPSLAERDRPLALLPGLIDGLARAMRQADAGDAGEARRALEEARALGAALAEAPNGTFRIVERLLAGTMASVEGRAGQLTVARDGTWFAAPDADPVLLHTRKTLTRVLRTLIEAREADPGVPLAVPDLFAGGWPGQHVAEEAAANRVYNAVSTLRGLGFDIIERRTDGYLLPAEVPLRLSDAAQPI